MSSNPDLTGRIQAMFVRDRLFAWLFVVALWLVVGYVLLVINPHIPDGGLRVVSWIAALVLVVFNTASIAAMVRHYAHDKQFIYELDIRHLDAGR